MTKKYQTTAPNATPLVVPEEVSIPMGEIAADMREGLLALAVGVGLHYTGVFRPAGEPSLR